MHGESNLGMGEGKARTRVLFDTSGINKLHDDPHREAILAKLESSFWIRISETNFGELCSTPGRPRRMSLLDLCQSFLAFGDCLMPHHWIITQMAETHRRHRSKFRWQDVDVRAPLIAQEIVQRRFSSDERLVKEQRDHMKTAAKKFLTVLSESRKAFEGEYQNWDELPSLTELIAFVKENGGPFWKRAADIYETLTLATLNEQEIRQFLNICPPFHAVALVESIGHYQYALPKRVEPSKYKAHFYDLLMGCHLPYCDLFVTNEKQQQNALEVIAAEVGLVVSFKSYQQFADDCQTSIG